MSFDYSTPAIEKWQIDKFSEIVDEFEDTFADCVNQKTDTVTDYQMILLHIAGKILVTTREILILCAHGYPDGALSLGRNLYEQMMIVLFFEMHKHDAGFQNYTNDYLLSYQIQRNKSLRDIEKYIPDGNTAALNNEYEELKKQASQKVKGDYWWTGFSTFSALADSIIQNETNQTLRSFLGRHYATYKRACISLHAGCMGNTIRIGSNVNFGVVDTSPTLYGQSTALRYAATSLIPIIGTICISFNLNYESYIEALNELAKVYQKQEKEDMNNYA